MYKVCAHYCGTSILIDRFPTEKDAQNFINSGRTFTIRPADDENEEEYVYDDEMYIIDENTEEPYVECEPPDYSAYFPADFNPPF